MATVREKAAALSLSGKIFNPMHRPPDYRVVNKPFQANSIWSSIIANLQAQVKVKRRRHYLKSHSNCFLGSDAVDVILAYIVQNKLFGDADVERAKVVRVCQALMDCKVFEVVGTKVFGKENKLPTFQDTDSSLYRFLNTENPSLDDLEHALLCPSIQGNTSCSWQDEQVFSHSTPMKSDQTLGALLEDLDPSFLPSTNPALPQSLINEVWQEQTVLRLLQLIELPLLDGLLDCRESHSPPSSSMTDDPDLLCTSSYLDRETLKAFRDSQTDDWLSAAVDCLECLPDKLVVEVSRELPNCSEEGDVSYGQPKSMGIEQCKLLLFDILTKHYGQSNFLPLLTNRMFEVYAGIAELLVNGKFEQALEALQLCLKLLPVRSREELRRLMYFMALAADPREIKLHKEIENRIVVKRAFSKAIVHSKCLPKGKVDLLVLFMLDNPHDIFKIPGSLHKLVSDQLANLMQEKGTDPITANTFCQQVAGKTCAENVKGTTNGELLALLRNIDEDPKYSLKEKKRLLAQFYTGHPEIFVQYFGSRVPTLNVL